MKTTKKKKYISFGTGLLTLLTLKLWLVGCALIGYMAWVLATSVTTRQFVAGNLIFTYIVIAVGFLLFITGLLGWVGASSGSVCILRMYIMVAVLVIALEVGGVLTMSIIRMEISDVIEHGWGQVNQVTRNAVQQHFDCCGFSGPKEFAYQNDPIDDTCYENGFPVDRILESVEVTPQATVPGSTTDQVTESSSLLKQRGCGRKLLEWFDDNKAIWVTIVVGIGLLEILGVLSAIYVINRTQRFKHEQMLDEFKAERNHYHHHHSHRR